MCYIHTMEYYLELKNEGIPEICGTWMNLEDITLSEIIPLQKDKFCVISLEHGHIEQLLGDKWVRWPSGPHWTPEFGLHKRTGRKAESVCFHFWPSEEIQKGLHNQEK